MLTNIQLKEFVVKAYEAGWVYWYGTYGNKCTKSLYNSKKKQYDKHYVSSRTSKYMKQIEEGRYCADCIGLGKAFVWSGGVFQGTTKYATNGLPDKSADGMFEYAKKKGLKHGKISTIPEVVGLAVRMGGHVGYYIGNGEVIEERGFSYGCVKTKLKDRKWTDWYEFPAVEYVEEPKKEEATPVEDTGSYIYVKNGSYYVRVEANKNSKSIGVARSGERIPYLGTTKNGWYSVRYQENNAYISSRCGVIVTDIVNDKPIEESKATFTVAKGTWNIRKGPGTSYKVLCTVKAGTKIEYLGKNDNGWYNVKAGNYEGWISSRGVKK